MLLVLLVGLFSCSWEPLGEQDGRLVMDEQFFLNNILPASPRFQQTPVHLIGFIDPIHDCPVCLQEMFQWVFHLDKETLFDLTLFVKEGVPSADLDELLTTLGINREKVVFFGEQDPANQLHKYGVFRVVYAPARGILWYGLTARDPREHLIFKDRLGQVLGQLQK